MLRSVDNAICSGILKYMTRPRGYKTFFMLNSIEYEISTAHKNLNTDK